jgi:hypothetical protein
LQFGFLIPTETLNGIEAYRIGNEWILKGQSAQQETRNCKELGDPPHSYIGGWYNQEIFQVLFILDDYTLSQYV